MDTVTYPTADVSEFMNNSVVPVQIASDAEPFAKDFNIKWTPTLITLSATGEEHHRSVGFLSAEELIPSLLLGMAKVHFDNDRFSEALAELDKILAQFPDSDSAPESIFLRGVCRYKSSNDPMPLREAYDELTAKAPGNEWTKRAYPYRLIG